MHARYGHRGHLIASSAALLKGSIQTEHCPSTTTFGAVDRRILAGFVSWLELFRLPVEATDIELDGDGSTVPEDGETDTDGETNDGTDAI